MKQLTFYLFLLLSLTACTDREHTGPDGAIIYGPYGKHHVLMYTVLSFQPHYPGSLDYLRHLAWEAVDNDGDSGEYMVLFIDRESGRPVLTEKYLLFKHAS